MITSALLQGIVASLWQSALLAIIAAIALRLTRANAATKFVIWFSVMIASLIIIVRPLVLIFLFSPANTPSSAAVSAAGQTEFRFFIPATYAAVFLFLLAAGTVCKLLRLVASFFTTLRIQKISELPSPAVSVVLQRVVSRCMPERQLEVRLSRILRYPVIAGFLRPVILFPFTTVTSLSERELEQIVLHEIAHLNRRDHWTQLLQRVFECLLFYHPVAVWCGRKMDLEREIACDDRVISTCSDQRSYAELLMRLVEFRSAAASQPLAAGVLHSKTQLSRRIETMLDRNQNRTSSISKAILLTAVNVTAFGFLLFSAIPPLVAVTDEESKPAKQEQKKQQQTGNENEEVHSNLRHEVEREKAFYLGQQKMIEAQRKMQEAARELELAGEMMRSGRGADPAMHEEHEIVIKQLEFAQEEMAEVESEVEEDFMWIESELKTEEDRLRHLPGKERPDRELPDPVKAPLPRAAMETPMPPRPVNAPSPEVVLPSEPVIAPPSMENLPILPTPRLAPIQRPQSVEDVKNR